MKMKKLITLFLMIGSSLILNSATPLQQAVEIRDGIRDIKVAVQKRGQECTDLASIPKAIEKISDITDFIQGKYIGEIIINDEQINGFPFTFIDGKYSIKALSLKLAQVGQFKDATGLQSFTAPVLESPKLEMLANCPNLVEVNLPAATYSATQMCSNDTNLITANLPNATTIYGYSYYNCSKLKTFASAPLTIINPYSFYNCQSLTNVNINSESCTFGNRCFENCKSLKSIKWPTSWSFGNNYVFANSGLESVNLENVATFGTLTHSLFEGCPLTNRLELTRLLTLSGASLFKNCQKVTDIICPELTQIGTIDTSTGYYSESSGGNNNYEIFRGMTSVTNIYMPKLETIYSGEALFLNQTRLKHVKFPELTQIGRLSGTTYYGHYNIFYNCINLESVEMPKLKNLYNVNNMFAYCYSLTNVVMPAVETLTLDSLSYGNDNYVFLNCNNLKNLSFPNLKNSYYNNGRSTLRNLCYNCINLENVYMPITNLVTNTGFNYNNFYEAFKYCYNLKNITLGMDSAKLLKIGNFPGYVPTSAVFHCPSEAPYDVDVVYKNGKWQSITNGTFKLVKFIKGTGTQYINTGVVYQPNMVITIDVELDTSANQYAAIFGAGSGNVSANAANRLELYSRFNNVDKFKFYKSNISGDIAEHNTGRFIIKIDGLTCSIYDTDGSLLYDITLTDGDLQTSGPLALFTVNSSTTSTGFSPMTARINDNMKLYRFTVVDKETEETLCDLIPGLHNDEPLMLDKAKKYLTHYNFGTGNFEYGSITNENISVEK